MMLFSVLILNLLIEVNFSQSDSCFLADEQCGTTKTLLSTSLYNSQFFSYEISCIDRSERFLFGQLFYNLHFKHWVCRIDVSLTNSEFLPVLQYQRITFIIANIDQVSEMWVFLRTSKYCSVKICWILSWSSTWCNWSLRFFFEIDHDSQSIYSSIKQHLDSTWKHSLLQFWCSQVFKRLNVDYVKLLNYQSTLQLDMKGNGETCRIMKERQLCWALCRLVKNNQNLAHRQSCRL